jgi:tellurite resistance protein
MTRFVDLPELPKCDDHTLAKAVRKMIAKQAREVATPTVGPRALLARLPKIDRMEHGAEQLFSSIPPASHEDEAAGKYFSAIVEACFLVAAADGLAAQESGAVTELIRFATGEVLSHERADELFESYEQLLRTQGLEARLDAVAERLDDFLAREECMSFAALIAVADGELSEREVVALMALAKRFDFSAGEVQLAVQKVAIELAEAIGEALEAS